MEHAWFPHGFNLEFIKGKLNIDMRQWSAILQALKFDPVAISQYHHNLPTATIIFSNDTI